MKVYLSVNYKFMDKSPLDMVNYIYKLDTKKAIKGFELCFDYKNEKEVQYMRELMRVCSMYGLDLQFHGNSNLSIDDMKEYLDMINKLSEVYMRSFNIVLHPLSTEIITHDIELSQKYFSEVLNYIYDNKYKIYISVENLNHLGNTERCGKEELEPLLSNNMDLLFTYDVGHEISDYGKITDLKDEYIMRLCNVHLHTFDFLEDHQELLPNDEYKEKWIKAILYLRTILYDGPVVLEFDFYKLGEDFESRMTEYINNSIYINNYL